MTRDIDTWLGDGAVLATLHLPERPRTVGVVICPPFGHEQVLTYRAQRHLADRLADAGFPVVRYDHPGFGDSTLSTAYAFDTSPDDDPVLDGVRLASEALTNEGCTSLVYIGLSSGALVAATAAERLPNVAGVVLWDPPTSGRQWLRRARALYSLTVAGARADSRDAATADDGAIVGADLDEDISGLISALTYDADSAVRMPMLVALRDDPASSLPTALKKVEPFIDVIRTAGQAELLDRSSLSARIPGAGILRIAEWVADTFSDERLPVFARSGVDGSVAGAGARTGADGVSVARFGVSADAGPVDVEERIVRVGPNELFGIETKAVGVADDAPALLLLSGSSEHRIGVSRLQVEIARALAPHGIRSLRIDRRGTGESTPVDPDEKSLLFTQEWLDDTRDAVAHLSSDPSRVGIAGLSVGSWLGFMTAAGTARFVIALSPGDFRLTPAEPDTFARADEADPDDPGMRDRIVTLAKRRLPYRALLAMSRAGLLQFAEPLLRIPLTAGTNVHLFFTPHDAALFEERGGTAAVRRLAGLPGTLDLVLESHGDHALFARRIRESAVQAAVRLSRDEFADTAVPAPAVLEKCPHEVVR